MIVRVPLASGLLTGKIRKDAEVPRDSRLAGRMGETFLGDDNLERAEALIAFSEGRGHSVLELAFSWLLRHPEVASVIAGATKVAQIEGNAGAVGWQLTDDELATVDSLVPAR